MRIRFFSFIITAFVALSALWGQSIGEWKVYPSYWEATQNITVRETVYSLYNGNLLSYNTQDGEVRTYHSLNILNGERIRFMAYSEEAKCLIVVYDDFNIDLIDANENVRNLSSLRDKVLPGKEVQGISIIGKSAFLGTRFGFIEIDLKEGIFRNTYKLDLQVNSLAKAYNHLYAATPNGLYKCALTENMHDAGNWIQVKTAKYFDLVTFENQLLARHNSVIYRVLEDGTTRNIISGTTRFMQVSGNMLICGLNDGILTGTSLSQLTTVNMLHNWNDASYGNGIFWASEGLKGLNGYKLDGTTFKPVNGPIQPNSPARDLFYRMHWHNNRLLVAGGINTPGAIYHPATAMYLEDGKWTNFQETEKTDKYPNLLLYNTTNLVEDPNDPTRHFSSPYRNGLCEYKNGKFVKLYNSDNSPLKSILPNEPTYYNFVSCSGLKYDSDGNLWMCNSLNDTIIRILKPNGKWVGLYYKEIANASLCDDYLMHSSGLIFLNSRARENNGGFFCLDTNGTLENTRDDRHRLRSTIINQDGTSYSPNEYYCMAEDFDGRIWCGTDYGLFVINDAESFLDEDFRFEQVKIARNDGSGLADYLLNGAIISCITVDGANRKWIGTNNNGLYLVSADGTEMIHHFMTDNSPLLHNNIKSIAVNPVSGEVMVGTEMGLCSYMSNATEAAEQLEKSNVLAYPNPVRSDYTGPIAVKGLTMDAEVKILSTTGQLVWSGISNGGTFTWNGCNKSGRRVASGVYHVVANNAEGKKTIVTRIIVIK